MKRILKLASLITAIIMTATIISSCTGDKTPSESDVSSGLTTDTPHATAPSEAGSINLVANAAYVLVNGERLPAGSLEAESCAFSGKSGAYAEVYYNEPVDINTVIFKEGSENTISSIKIEAEQNGDYALIYSQDEVGAYRYCAFPTVTTKALRFTVVACENDADFVISSIEAYNKSEANATSLKSFAYIVSNTSVRGTFDKESLAHVTDVILFGLVSFDADGNVYYNDITVDDITYTGTQAMDKALENVRAAFTANGVTPKLHFNILGPNASGEFEDWDAEMDAKGELHLSAMDTNRDKLIEGINGIINAYGFDGVCFDYEYPLKTKYTNAFSDFIVKLDEAIGEKEIGSALASWCCTFKKKAVEAIDNVLVMSYDAFDARGNHSPFACAVNDVKLFNEAGYKNEQLILGIPFYSRPADKGAFWYDYSIEAATLGKFGNRTDGAAPAESDGCTTRWYNGYQMTYDKTAYAIELGLKGVMVWHLGCDMPYANELSLIRAIASAQINRALPQE